MFVQRKVKAKDDYKYCGNGGRSWVTAESKHIDYWPTYESAFEDGIKNYKSNFKFGRDWVIDKIEQEVM